MADGRRLKINDKKGIKSKSKEGSKISDREGTGMKKSALSDLEALMDQFQSNNISFYDDKKDIC